MKNKGIIFLLVGLLMSCASPTPPQVHDQWLDATATEQLAAMEQGLLKSETLIKGYLERIERLDKQGPTINSVLSLISVANVVIKLSVPSCITIIFSV